MNSHNARMDSWPPKKIPKSLAGFTPHRDGWVRWYRGQTRFVCGRTVPLDQVEDRWAALKSKIERNETRPITINRHGVITLKEVAGLFIARQRHRLEKGRPAPLSPHTFHDYVKMVELLRDAFGADRDVTTLGHDDFVRLARRFDKQAPSTLTRTIAYIKAFFTWAEKAGVIPDVPDYGPDFVKPSAQEKRDHRLSSTKAYKPSEVLALWKAASHEERCWIALGVNCAFDNSDIASLTLDVVDLDAGIIDFRRRKKGKIRRVCPLREETLEMLRMYERPKAALPEYEDLFFLSPSGLPLIRVQPSRKDELKLTQIDAISVQWKRLLSRAGVRGPITFRKLPTGKVRAKYPKGDGRGFRSLRTTFANLKPHGYTEEVEIVMGHAHGSVLLDNYLEEVGYSRLRELVAHVWTRAFTTETPKDQSASKL